MYDSNTEAVPHLPGMLLALTVLQLAITTGLNIKIKKKIQTDATAVHVTNTALSLQSALEVASVKPAAATAPRAAVFLATIRK